MSTAGPSNKQEHTSFVRHLTWLWLMPRALAQLWGPVLRAAQLVSVAGGRGLLIRSR